MINIVITEAQFKKLLRSAILKEAVRIANPEQNRIFNAAVEELKDYILRYREAPSQERQNFYYKRGYDYKYSFESLFRVAKSLNSNQSLDFAKKVAARALRELDDENKLHDFRK